MSVHRLLPLRQWDGGSGPVRRAPSSLLRFVKTFPPLFFLLFFLEIFFFILSFCLALFLCSAMLKCFRGEPNLASSCGRLSTLFFPPLVPVPPPLSDHFPFDRTLLPEAGSDRRVVYHLRAARLPLACTKSSPFPQLASPFLSPTGGPFVRI